MANILGALALNQVQFQQEMAITAIKRNLESQEDIVQLVSETSGSNRLAAGPQPLNAEGLSQIVNELV